MRKNITSELKTGKISTPIGDMLAAASDNGISLLEFTGLDRCEKNLSVVSKNLNFGSGAKAEKLLDELFLQITEYFAGKRRNFNIPLDINIGTLFQKQAWDALLTIPYGITKSYKEQAEIINNPKAVRAIGNANKRNPISIIVPCHRVIGANGKLVGYGGGLWRKEYLLNLEFSNKKNK
ncbi:MAG TPA: methylated-DNA--[protein]-cysteine S-methyltransferase [Victivallales bacterium]|nr:methylated-DNA--[protein]-cysteine S-methyltransferase [Victivallales bacterium]